MQNKLFTSATSKASAAIAAALFISAVLFSLSLFITEHSLIIKYKIEDISDILFAAAVIIHLLWLISINLFRKSGRMSRSADFFISSTLIFFLFNYLFAANAGLEYVQRFAETSDVLNFAPDTGTERILNCAFISSSFLRRCFCVYYFQKR